MNIRTLILAAFLILSVGCASNEGPFESAGETIDNSYENVEDSVEDTGDAIEDSAEDVEDNFD